jgi:hypothetical protein
MPKRIYRAVPVQQIEFGKTIEQLSGAKKVVFGCDAAKESCCSGASPQGGQHRASSSESFVRGAPTSIG